MTRRAEREAVVFDPARVVDGIELSDDPILRYRPAAYTESVSRRSGPLGWGREDPRHRYRRPRARAGPRPVA